MNVEQGDAGLFYGIDPETPGAFVAGSTATETRKRVQAARLLLTEGRGKVDGHVLYTTELHGNPMLVPTPEWQTPSQLKETLLRLQHAAQQFYPEEIAKLASA